MKSHWAEYRSSSTLSFTSALDGGWEVYARPRPLHPGKENWRPLYRRLGGSQGRSGQVRKISPSAGFRSPDRPAHSQSLYWLRYPAYKWCKVMKWKFFEGEDCRAIFQGIITKFEWRIYEHFKGPRLWQPVCHIEHLVTAYHSCSLFKRLSFRARSSSRLFCYISSLFLIELG